MNNETLIEVQTAMLGALMRYPVGKMAYMTAWLAPNLDGDDNPTIVVLGRMARWMPEAYAECMAYLSTATSEEALDEFICNQINSYFGDEIAYEIDVITYGLDFPMLGIDVWVSEFWQNEGMDRVHTILGHFGLFANPDFDADDEGPSVAPEDGALRQAGDVAHYLSKDIEDRAGLEFDYLRCLLDWLFSNSGNTILDFDMNGFYESGIPTPGWDEFEFASTVWFEAVDLHHKAVKGMELIEDSTEWLTALLGNIQTIWKHMKKRKRDVNGHYSGLRFKPFTWPEPTLGEEAVGDPVVL